MLPFTWCTHADGSEIGVQEKIDGGPSALFDAVAILLDEDGAEKLSGMHEARVWVADAFAHKKFILYNDGARALLKAAGLPESPDGGMFALGDTDCDRFVETCGRLRFWERDA